MPQDDPLPQLHALQRQVREDIARIVERLDRNEEEYLRSLRHRGRPVTEPGQGAEEPPPAVREQNTAAHEELLAHLREAVTRSIRLQEAISLCQGLGQERRH